jgi:acyl transferase domain-containing protein/NADPH:quinone reductase-like Zn-dependent oxidoreductase/nucleoside-diphosphate-sugar epimerase/acyl carrier protein
MDDGRQDPDRKELLKTAYRKITELRGRLAEVELLRDAPVAVVGMGCRFPGGVEDPESFWRLLSQGLDGTTEIPADRWNVDDYYDPDPDAPNRMYVRRGGFINNVRGFDPLFFHVSPLEAASMDPQQRVLLEVAWEAIENAGHAPDELAGSRTGVFVGMSSGDYGVMAVQAMRQSAARNHTATGISSSIAAGHISYFLGLRGPCMALDTACSSALTSIHLAVESLRKGESTAALAGSVNLILAPDGNIIVCKARMLAPDGRCKTFDASADGYARSEGCAILMLKLLSQAQVDGDRVLAVIRGSACNQDGRTNGITAPSGNAQREVIQEALAAARLRPNDVDYVETHGTGTSLGDPIEVQALGEVFAPDRPPGRDLVLGAVKSNIGHLEAAAGMAAIGKVILALQKGQIPPNLHFQTPNPHIPWSSLPFLLPSRLTPWVAGGERRVAGVSAFGFSGTNVHMVLEQAPDPAPCGFVRDRDAHLLTLSAQSPKALSDLAARYVTYLAEAADANLGDICFTANAGRAHFVHRLAIVAGSPKETKAELELYISGSPHRRNSVLGVAPNRPPNLGLIIGEVPPATISRSLYTLSAAFRNAFDACAAAARDLFVIDDLSEGLTGGTWARRFVNDGRIEQRVLGFAIAFAMAAQWLDWGLTPVALAGFGAANCIAAALAGAVELENAMLLAIDARVAETMPFDWTAPRIPVISAATGQPLSAVSLRRFREDERADSSCSSKVAGVLEGMRREGVRLLLAIGETGLDNAAAPNGGEDRDPAIVFAGCSGWADILNADAALYVAGAPPDWRRFEAHWPRRRLALPTYPFQRQECWLNVAPPSPSRPALRQARHPILGRRAYARQFRDEIVYESELNAETSPLLKDHSYNSTAVVAMAIMLDMAVSAARACLGGDAMLEGVATEQPLLLPPGQTRLVQTVLTPTASGRFAFSIASIDLDDPDRDSWQRHCSGETRVADRSAPPSAIISDLAATYSDVADANWFYEAVAGYGWDYGPAFRLMRDIWRGDEGAVVRLALPPELSGSAREYALHPGILDCAIQSLGLPHSLDRLRRAPRDAYMPVGVERLRLSTRGLNEVWCHATLRPRQDGDPDTLIGDLALFTPTGEWVGDVDGVQFRRNAKRQLGRELDERRLENWLYDTRWAELPEALAAAPLTGRWLVFGEGPGIAGAFSAQMRARGGQAILAEPGDDFSQLDIENFVVRLNVEADYDRMLTAVGGAERISGVVWVTGGALTGGRAADLPALARQAARNLLQLTQALLRNGIGALGRLALVTQGFARPCLGTPVDLAAGAVWGMGRVIVAELSDLNCGLYDVDPALTPPEAAELLSIELAAASPENQVSLRKAGRAGLRLRRTSKGESARHLDGAGETTAPVQLEVGARGDFGQLRFVPQRIEPPGPGEVQLRLLATAMNFRDVLNVLGLYPGDPGDPGVECVGEIVAIGSGVESYNPGDRVLAIPRRGYCTYANAPVGMVFPCPPNLSVAEAATLLVAYLTAAYALRHVGGMARGHRVLIHAAAGGVGLAAVQLAQRAGAEIFATAGSPAKREYLRQLGVPHVMDSRSLDFATLIRAVVGERGVDLVLNSLTGPAMTESLSLVGPGGVFLEIGKTEVFTPEQAQEINSGAKHHVIDLLAPFQDSPELMQGLFADVVEGLATGSLRPLPHRSFALADVQEAFRYMAAARQIGKVVVVDRGSGAVRTIDPSGSYLITGGLGGLGLVAAEALAKEGARHLILVSRRSPDGDAAVKIKQIEALGARVSVASADVADRAQLEAVLAANLSPANPLRGVIHAAGVIDDGALAFQSEARFDQVMASKIDGAWHLHELTQKMPLDFFILFSSGAGLFGNPGQSSYGAASVFLDALATARHAAGLPALSIDWGPWSQVGMAARMEEGKAKGWESRGLRAMTPDEGATVLRMLIDFDRAAKIAVLPLQSDFRRQNAERPTISPFLTDLADAPAQAPSSNDAARMAERLKRAAPPERLGVLIEIVSEIVVELFGLERSGRLAPDQNLTALGMDSLLAIQLSNRLKTAFAVALPATLAFQQPTVQDIGEYLLEKISSFADSPAGSDSSAVALADSPKRDINFRNALRLRRVRRSPGGDPRGRVVGIPGLHGHGAEIGVVAKNALEDYDVWAFTVDTDGGTLEKDGALLDCAEAIADRLLAETDPPPRAFIGFSLGAYTAWLVDRLLVAAGRPATPLINFDGPALHVQSKPVAEYFERRSPGPLRPDGSNMLLLHRATPGAFSLSDRPYADWVTAGVGLKALPCRTIDHLDVVRPAAVAAVDGVLQRFIEGAPLKAGPGLDGLDFDTIGGTLFRLLAAGAPPDRETLRPLAEDPTLPPDGTVRLALLLLTLASGDAAMALELARRMTAEEPHHHAATYAQVALASLAWREDEAVSLAQAWRRDHRPNDQAMLDRARNARPKPAAWGSIPGCDIGSDEALDMAVQLCARDAAP